MGVLAWSALALVLLPLTATQAGPLIATSLAISLTSGLGPVLQVRLMDVAGEGQTLAAALHHAAFNIANALGPWLAGLAISAGYGWSAAGPVGATMAGAGLIVLAIAMFLLRKDGDNGRALTSAVTSPDHMHRPGQY